MSETPTAPSLAEPVAAPPPPKPAALGLGAGIGLGALALVALVALALAWQSHSRLRDLEPELVRRQATSQSLAAEAKQSAQASSEQVRELSAKLALLDAKLAEVALQRGQLEELLQSFTRSRDENVVGDIEASLRVANQQMVLVGSAEPLIAALKQAEERLQRYKQPRLEGVRRALLRDLDRVKAINAVDPGTLAMRLDEVSRLVDELPLLSEPQRQERRQTAAARPADAPASGAWARWLQGTQLMGQRVWDEARGLVRVTRIDQPEAMLTTPEQAFLLRENLKLRLLNARLALLSRQHEAARLDLNAALQALQRHADTRQRRSQLALELINQVLAQARPVSWPRPEDSLAALAAAGGGLR
jgi:uroporphyrin-III C-methyltransferase